MKKTIVALLLIVALVASLCIGLVACNNDDESFKIGLICLHDENSTYDANFINAMKEVQKELGLKDSQVIIVTGIPETDACYTAAANLVDKGCDIIFADSFGHEDFMIQAAKDFPSVQFCHATGYQAATANLDNFGDAFASIYQGRYLVGVAAGMKLLEMYGSDITAEEATIGYVGAFTYAEVVSGYSSFYLGVKSVVPNVTMKVQFTGSWYDEKAEKAAALNLIEKGCNLISQHADSMGAPTACKEKNVPNITYNISTEDQGCSGSFVAASRINWAPYYKYVIAQVQAGEKVAHDWVGTIATDSVQVIGIGAAAAQGTEAALETVKASFAAGFEVFDVTKFKVAETKVVEKDGEETTVETGNYITLTSTLDANVKTVGEVTYYAESGTYSAPSFAYRIEGIDLLNSAY